MNEQNTKTALLRAIDDFIKLESAGGILLLAAAVLALIIANSPITHMYDSLLNTTVAVQDEQLHCEDVARSCVVIAWLGVAE